MSQILPLVRIETQSALRSHAERLSAVTLTDLAGSEARADGLTRSAHGLVLDATRQRIDLPALAALITAADESGLRPAIDALFAGLPVNNTESRPALHTALRASGGPALSVGETDVRAVVAAERERCRTLVSAVSGGVRKGATGQRFTDVVNIGIGGSDLGPVMALEALHSHANPRIRVHFVSNVDGTQLADVLAGIEPASTLFIVCSKTFTTQETLANARLARRWIVDKLGVAAVSRHFLAVSVNHGAMDDFGIAADGRFSLWDWVGGRYSVWSAIGLSIEIALGSPRFEEFLAGAAAIDQHFKDAPFERNLPVLHGLLAVWNRNLLNHDTLAVLPYDQRLHRFPAYLQQLMMESNGKRVRKDGTPVTCDTCPIVWGEPGSNSQHSFFQLLHQGTTRTAMDFLLAAESSVGLEGMHELAVANCVAQAEAFAYGYSRQEAEGDLLARGTNLQGAAELAPHKVHPGNRPSTMLMFERLDAVTLGKLVALYEHSVYVTSVLWDVNPFDQWGVELGKRLAEGLLPAVRGEAVAAGSAGNTLAVLAKLRGGGQG